jgi:crossover junction endodeoxyribonuclease RuvC
MYYIGIDNGISGGFAVIDEAGNSVIAGPMPVKKMKNGKNWVDVKALDALIGHFSDSKGVIESAHAMPGQGVSSMFSFGMSYAFAQAVLEINNIPYEIVGPKTWQKLILPCQDDTKVESLQWANKHHPGLKVGKNHGISDALCMAEYARRLDLSKPDDII